MAGVTSLDHVWGYTPFGLPTPNVARAVARAGGLGFISVGTAAAEGPHRRTRTAEGLLESALSMLGRDLGVRVDGPDVSAASMARWSQGQVHTVVLAGWAEAVPDESQLRSEIVAWRQAGRRVVVEAISLAEAVRAEAAGADGVVLVGSDSGGRVGSTGGFVMLQQAAGVLTTPFWLKGGLGVHGAAAAVVGGATGVVLDIQLSLVREVASILPTSIVKAIAGMDGSETRVISGHRVYFRPGTLASTMVAGSGGGSDSVLGSPTGPDDPHLAGAVDSDVDPASSYDHAPSADLVLGLTGWESLDSQLLAAGQGGALAASLARHHVTVGGVVQAFVEAIESDRARADADRPLAAGSKLAERNRLRFPIAQGPMTRVSDRAEFASLVADAGGLPFLALSLLSAPEVRRLMTETAALLGDRPWGVGILGFVPAEIRDAQMEVVLDLKPPVALIAGGRPSQARSLDDAGITSFLHVPSPGLLDRFLRDGARRFVFEGRECGGHVGPRSSLLLWEQQIEVLSEFSAAGGTDRHGSLDGVEVLFAGGIHDARSAAMVATIAAPLTALGAAVGVLMGTAYLFCEEAVEGGAILPSYQQMALSCDQTVLLESSPGHATRCVDNQYVESFLRTRRDLEAEGRSSREVWAELEQMNLGRLRLASKGIARLDGSYVEVDEATRVADGMYMIGDVAMLRDGLTTVEELHSEVSRGATDFLAEHLSLTAGPRAVSGIRQREAPRPLDVAIVGMACSFPGAPDTGSFWSNILGGVDSITEVQPERWDSSRYWTADAGHELAGIKTPSKWGGFLPEVPFDALAYGIPPSSLASIEPTQLLALESAAKALADAGYEHRRFDRATTAVVFGAAAGTDLANAAGLRSLLPAVLGGIPENLDDWLPRLTEDSFPGMLANVVAGRIANRLDLGGMNCTVDAACASSLAALDVACKELQSGGASMVLCGGVDLHNGINDFLLFSSVHALSATGRTRAFDASADGIALGEGVACLVLKRLADAERDGDRVYAVVKSVAGSSDGKSLGLTAPRPEGQRAALERAYDRAGLDPSVVGLVEAHGTGTVVGDRTELGILTDVFQESGSQVGSCTLGSVKANIGHTKCAAGLAGLVKASQALWRGIRPPTIHMDHPNRAWNEEDSPFRFESVARPWIEEHRYAGVSSFGFGGSNFHVVLASNEDNPPEHGLDEWPVELFVFKGKSVTAALDIVRQVSRLIEQASDGAYEAPRLRDLAASVAESGSGPAHFAVVAADLGELSRALAAIEEAPEAPAARPSSGEPRLWRAAAPDVSDRLAGGDNAVAFCFPGQGSQRPGMLGDLYVAFPVLRTHLERGRRWADLMLPPAAFGTEAVAKQKAVTADTRVAQPILGIAGLTMADLLGRLGVYPDATAGHSYGELVALAVAGSLPVEVLLEQSEARAEAIIEAVGDHPGTMSAVGAGAPRVEAVLRQAGIDDVVVANHNAPTQSVISGPTDSVAAAHVALSGEGIGAKKLAVACAFHSPVVASGAQTFAAHLAGVNVTAPRVPVWSNTLAEPYPQEPEAIREVLVRQVAEPVRWVEQVEAMYDSGCRVFIEAGPGRVLSQLVDRILGDRPHVSIACDTASDHGLVRLMSALAEMAVHGVDVDTSMLFRGRAKLFDLQGTPTKAAGWAVSGRLVRHRTGEIVSGALQPFDTMPQVVTGAAGGSSGSGGGGEAEAALVHYLDSMREMVAAQRDVMLTYFGAGEPQWETAVPVASGPAQLTGGVTAGRADARSTSSNTSNSDQSTSGVGTAGAVAQDGTGRSRQDAGGSDSVDPDFLLAAVVRIVAARTGYPVDMLDPDHDLEADLSIDSIKRIEILGELAEQVGLPGAVDGEIEDAVIEELAQIKTMRGIVDWIIDKGPQDGSTATSSGSTRTGDDRHTDSVSVPLPASEAVTDDPGASSSTARDDAMSVKGDAPHLQGDPHQGQGGASSPATASALAVDVVSGPTLPGTQSGSGGSQRSAVRLVKLKLDATVDESTPEACPDFRDKVFAIVDDGRGVALGLATLLEEQGARVRMVPAGKTDAADAFSGHPGSFDGWIDLSALAPDADVSAPGIFPGVKKAALTGSKWILAASGLGGRLGFHEPGPEPAGRQGAVSLLPGSGIAGLCRSVALETPGVLVRAVDVDPKLDSSQLANMFFSELKDQAGPSVVGRMGQDRWTTEVIPLLGADSGGPVASPRLFQDVLEPGSVVVLTGGARGVTSHLARALSGVPNVHLVLLGRTELVPTGETDEVEASSAVAEATDEVSMRSALAAAGIRDPKEVQRRTAGILARREIRSTLAELAAAGADSEYLVCDVSDQVQVGRVLDQVAGRYGRVDLVVHGAGIIEDKLLAEKSEESFARVYRTKVEGALASARWLDASGRRSMLVLMASVSGVFGNQGQCDYAAANDTLDCLARSLDRHPTLKLISVDWGPWEGAGMVTAELAREYRRRGVPLLGVDAGVAQLMEIVGSGVRGDDLVGPQIVITGPVRPVEQADPAGSGAAQSTPAGHGAG